MQFPRVDVHGRGTRVRVAEQQLDLMLGDAGRRSDRRAAGPEHVRVQLVHHVVRQPGFFGEAAQQFPCVLAVELPAGRADRIGDLAPDEVPVPAAAQVGVDPVAGGRRDRQRLRLAGLAGDHQDVVAVVHRQVLHPGAA